MKRKLQDYFLLVYGDASHGTVELFVATEALLKEYSAEIDAAKNKWRVVGLGGPPGLGGRGTSDQWRRMGDDDLSTDTISMQESALICVYESSNFKHLQNMVSVASEALKTSGSYV